MPHLPETPTQKQLRLQKQAARLESLTQEERVQLKAYWDEWGPKMKAGGGGFQPGQPRPPFSADGAGRKASLRASRANLRQFITELERYDLFTADPVEVLIYMAATGKDPLDWRKPKEEQANISLDIRVDCAKAAGPFVRPRLSATEISGKEGGAAIKLETADLDVMTKDPKVRAAFEQVSQQLAEHVLEHADEHEDAAELAAMEEAEEEIL